jgi:peptide/nickel transport system substrate-binding protein
VDEDPVPHGITRREIIKAGALSGGLALVGPGLLAACGSGGATSASKARTAYSVGPPAGTPVKGGTLRVGLVTGGNAETIDVRLAANTPDVFRVYQLYDPMFYVAPFGGGVAPGLVEHSESNKQATLWTFRLRDGVVWHDGKPLTADDLLYTIRQWASPKSNAHTNAEKAVDIKGIRKLDGRTVQVPLKLGLAEFPTLLANQNFLVIQDGFTDYAKPVGTGPFKFGSFTPGSRSEFTANKNYWREGTPHVDSIVIDTSYASDETRLNALLSGAIDIMPYAPPALAQSYRRAGKIHLGNQPGPGWTGPCFRVDKKPFDDPRVRRALKLIPDREAVVSQVFDGLATVGNDCGGYTDDYWASDLKIHQDIDQARSLLKSAGHSNLSLTLQTSPFAQGVVDIATLFARDAKRAGVNVNVKKIDPSIYYTAAGGYQTRPFNVTQWFVGMNSLTVFHLEFLVKGAPYTETNFGDAKSDALIYGAMAETDPARAKEKWHAVQEQQVKEGPVLIVENYNWVDAYGLNVRGTRTTNAGSCNNADFTTTWLKA